MAGMLRGHIAHSGSACLCWRRGLQGQGLGQGPVDRIRRINASNVLKDLFRVRREKAELWGHSAEDARQDAVLHFARVGEASAQFVPGCDAT